MVLSRQDFFGKGGAGGEDYRVRMLLENHIQGLLPVTHRMVDGESRYYYEINSLQSLDRLLDKKEIGYRELRALLIGCISLFDRLEEYLLDGSRIIMRAEYIYMDVERMEPYFVCYPEYDGDARASFMTFIDELLVRIDHADEQAVLLGYQVYRYTRNPNYVLSEIRRMMEQISEEPVGSTAAKAEALPRMEPQDPVKVYETCSGKGTPEYGSLGWEEELAVEPAESRDSGGRMDLIGAGVCVFIALSVAAVLLGARTLTISGFGREQELCLYGAVAMAAAAAVIFVVCFIKKKRRGEDTEEAYLYPRADAEAFPAERFMDRVSEKGFPEAGSAMEAAEPGACNDTICLGGGVIEERVLRGRIRDREVTVDLSRLPLTVGKLGSFADYVINDNTVSKMHARFEERDGRVYLCDLNSTNGTVRNGVMLDINAPVLLEPGDRLRFGRTSFTYC
ncbi:MAG: FHA domain-containing protein [Roseburia sp.]|nr:FHA domain-containing protein [Roseburia sp.]